MSGYGNRDPRRLTALLICIVLAAAAASAGLYFAGSAFEHRGDAPETRGDASYRLKREIVFEKDGVSYAERKHITTVLLMGIDRDTASGEISKYDKRSGGQADFIRLLVIDDDLGEIRQLAIDRDTMTPITILGVLGNKSGVRTAQICLSHGFGDGREESCLLAKEAVSNYLYGLDIDSYFAVDLNGIPVLNDLAGGVTMTFESDYSDIEAEWTEGATVTFDAKGAERFVRARLGTQHDTNEMRMDRQEKYLDLLADSLYAKEKADKTFAGEVFDALGSMLVSDMPRGRLINTAWAARDYKVCEPVAIEGEHRTGSDGFMQFYPDEESLENAMIGMFYEPVDDDVVDPKG